MASADFSASVAAGRPVATRWCERDGDLPG